MRQKENLIEEGKAQAIGELKKNRKCLILFNKVVINNEPLPKYNT